MDCKTNDLFDWGYFSKSVENGLLTQCHAFYYRKGALREAPFSMYIFMPLVLKGYSLGESITDLNNITQIILKVH